MKIKKTDESSHTAIDPALFQEYRRLSVLVIGDVMLDHYITADVDRTSPEAPVAIALVRSEYYVAGGAANVAANLRAMGAKVNLAGVIGQDEGGEMVRSLLMEKGIRTSFLITDKARPTTLKTRILSRGQQIIRIDREKKESLTNPLSERMIDVVIRRTEKLDGVIISDYGKGVCTPALIADITRIMKERGIPVLCDPKGLDYSKYRGVAALTPNFKEAQEASGIVATDEETLALAARRIMSATGARGLVVTRGADGVSLFQKGKAAIHIPAHAREVYDVTGAGDTFISHFGLGVFSGLDFETSVKLGNYASAIAVGKLGVAVVTPEELTQFIRSETFGTKIKSLEEMREISASLKTRGKKVVFTNGCFDFLHVGHIKFLQAARSLGDCLVVGINTDASVRTIKGQGRPLIGENERADLLASLHWVDYVILFDGETPEPLLRALKPDILVKGKNLSEEEIVGHTLVKSYGGQVHRLPFFSSVSTSERLRHILENLKKDND